MLLQGHSRRVDGGQSCTLMKLSARIHVSYEEALPITFPTAQSRIASVSFPVASAGIWCRAESVRP